MASKYSPYIRLIKKQTQIVFQDFMGKAGAGILLLYILMALLAPIIAPEGPFKAYSREDGTLAKLEPPSAKHWFGTTFHARDVLSQTLWGARIAIFIGFLSAISITLIGTTVGLVSGYYSGIIDDILMRITDIAYGIPFLPLCILLVSILKPSIWNILLAIVLLFWRSSARVIRSQVLSLKERPFIWSAKAAGAGDMRILFIHIFPNVIPMSLLYLALGIGWGVMTEASLSFLGLGDPMKISWGGMLYDAFQFAAMRKAWWWVIPPGFSIALFVVSAFLLGRSYEEIVNPKLRKI